MALCVSEMLQLFSGAVWTGRVSLVGVPERIIVRGAVQTFPLLLFLHQPVDFHHSGAPAPCFRHTGRHVPQTRLRRHAGDKVELALVLDAAVDQVLSHVPRANRLLQQRPVVHVHLLAIGLKMAAAAATGLLFMFRVLRLTCASRRRSA